MSRLMDHADAPMSKREKPTAKRWAASPRLEGELRQTSDWSFEIAPLAVFDATIPAVAAGRRMLQAMIGTGN